MKRIGNDYRLGIREGLTWINDQESYAWSKDNMRGKRFAGRSRDMRITSEFYPPYGSSALVARNVAMVHLTMAAGLAVSAATAIGVYSSPRLYAALFTEQGLTLAGWVVALSPLAIVLLFAGAVQRLSINAARLLFVAFALLTGASLATLFAAYTAASIVATFVAAASGYAALALVGYATARDLSGLGKFMLVGLFGLIIAIVINLFFGSSSADFVLACIGVVVFSALVAVDSQRIRRIYERDEN